MSTIAPLNGVKTHPLSTHAKGVLRDIATAPVPRHSVNPGVTNRLQREGMVESIDLPSPYKTHQGKPIEHLCITAAGMAAIQRP